MAAFPFISKSLIFRAGMLSGMGLALLTTGCSSVKYLFQATRGQLSLLNHAKPISEVLQDERTPSRIRSLLAEVEPIKKFGEDQGIKPTKNYTEYVKLDRSAAVYVVSASDALEFHSKVWHFPIVGSFPYLGWFDLESAKEFAEDLRKEGLDVDLRGARAYSTLGWFRDSVLSTMIPEGDEALGELVNVVIHESVHATIYLNAQAYFNESIASFVADHLTETYLDRRKGATAASPDERQELAKLQAATKTEPQVNYTPSRERVLYVRAQADGERRQKRLHEAYESLNALYTSTEPNERKVERKNAFLAELKKELGFRREINNATLVQYKTYSTGQKDFEALWKVCGGDGRRFLQTLAKLTSQSFQKPQQEDLAPVLSPFGQAGCKP